MILTAYLVRHAPHDDIGRRLSGRTPGLSLAEGGAAIAGRLGERLRARGLSSVQASPLDRTMETARALAAPSGLDVEPVEALVEIDFGEWTGASFQTLAADPRWRAWNERRAEGTCPGGEAMVSVQRRVVDHLFATARRLPAAVVAMVTHADVIRAAVAHVLGLTLDHFHRFEVSPASITQVEIAGGHARLIQLNERIE